MDDEHLRAWWSTIDPMVQRRIRNLVNEPEVTIVPESLRPSLCIQDDGREKITALLTRLDDIIRTLGEEMEHATLTYYDLESATEEFLRGDGRSLEDLKGLLWRPLSEPRIRVEPLGRKLRILEGLMEEMNLAIDPDLADSLEEQALCSRRAGDEWKARILWEAGPLRKRFLQKGKNREDSALLSSIEPHSKEEAQGSDATPSSRS